MDEAFRWRRAKADLETKILGAYDRANRSEIKVILQDWFENTVFQMNINQFVDGRMLEQAKCPEMIKSELRRRAAHEIGEKIFESKTYYSETEAIDRFNYRITTSVLIVATPRFVQDNKTGMVSYIRD